MPPCRRFHAIVCLLLCPQLSPSELSEPPPGDAALRHEALRALRRAVEFFRTEVAVEGGYLWRYSEDLDRREGEGKATRTMAWVQRPGTPAVGKVCLEAHTATGDPYYLEAAREAARALVRGQLRSGGWDYRIEFDPEKRREFAYRVDAGGEGARNITTLDDDTTQAAVRFLLQADQALGLKDERIHEAVDYALESLLRAQYPNGAWPQRYERPPEPEKFPVRRASYPATWPRTHPGADYRGHYTFNDGTIEDTIRTLLEAARARGEPRYREAALKAGEFILLAQMPEPQPAWAQQYDADMHPAWARKFEPPAVTGGESQGVMRGLLTLYREKQDARYLDAVSRALAYLKRSRLADGRLARFYELETNRPLYFNLRYDLTYADDDLPQHYGFKVAGRLDAIERQMEELRARKFGDARPPDLEVPPRLDEGLVRRAREAVRSLDNRGRWVEEGRLKYHGAEDPTRRVIDCRTFIRNVETLSRYLRASR